MQDDALEDEKLARIDRFQFGKRVRLSPSMYSLWLSEDRPKLEKVLRARMDDGTEVSLMDIGGDND